jgi:hypothetical protein
MSPGNLGQKLSPLGHPHFLWSFIGSQGQQGVMEGVWAVENWVKKVIEGPKSLPEERAELTSWHPSVKSTLITQSSLPGSFCSSGGDRLPPPGQKAIHSSLTKAALTLWKEEVQWLSSLQSHLLGSSFWPNDIKHD